MIPFIRKLTSRSSFLFIIYNILSKFVIWPFLGFLTSVDLPWPRDTYPQKVYFKSVILIYNLSPFNEVRNLTLNDPKFVIWPQTQIFPTENNFKLSNFELFFAKIDHFCDFLKLNKSKPEIGRKTGSLISAVKLCGRKLRKRIRTRV